MANNDAKKQKEIKEAKKQIKDLTQKLNNLVKNRKKFYNTALKNIDNVMAVEAQLPDVLMDLGQKYIEIGENVPPNLGNIGALREITCVCKEYSVKENSRGGVSVETKS